MEDRSREKLLSLIRVAIDQTRLMMRAIEEEDSARLLNLIKGRWVTLSKIAELKDRVGGDEELSRLAEELIGLDAALRRGLSAKAEEVRATLEKLETARRAIGAYLNREDKPKLVDLGAV